MCIATTAWGLLQACGGQRPDAVLLDVHLPDLQDEEALAALFGSHPYPVIAVSADRSAELARWVREHPVQAYLAQPEGRAEVELAIALAIRQFAELQSLRREAHDLRRALDDRKVIERAKGELMRREGFDEQSAQRHLQKLASRHNQKLAAAAREILNPSESLGQ